MSVEYYTVTAHEAGQRIDNFLLKYFKKVPKSVIYRIVRKGEVRVDKKRVKPEYKLVEGEQIRIPPVRTELEQPRAATASEPLLELIDQAILHEDTHLIVVNKPAGLPVHGGSGVPFGLIEAFRQLRPNLPFVELVHRLDKDTSGLVMLAKSRPALIALHQMLKAGDIEKHYKALVHGRWQGGKRHISLDLKRENNAYQKMQVVEEDEDGQTAESIFKPISVYGDCTLMDIQILTGRMHQIRVQLAHLGFPILGDERYGDFKLNREYRDAGVKRLCLHAASLACYFELSGQKLQFEAPLPEDINQVLKALKGQK